MNRTDHPLVDETPATVDDLLAAVLTRPAGERDAALERACASHPALAATLRQHHAALARMGLLSGDGTVPIGVAFDADGALPRRLGDFELLERIGDGGMGVVYRARQSPLGREVALKLVRPDLAFVESTRARFRHEAQAIARLDHPGIVPIHTVGEVGGTPFLVMPLLEGRSLAALLSALHGLQPATLARTEVLQALATGRVTRPSPPAWLHDAWTSTAVRITVQVAEALVHAHGRGIVHRDVKPANVMLASDGRVLLLDFGLASAEARPDLTRPGMVMGSLAYASPEQVQGQKVDARTDVFALGVVLYELLALVAPFAASTTKATVQRVLTHDPHDVRQHNRAVGADLAAIVRKALEKERDARYASMAAFAADLRAWLLGGVLSVRPDTAWRRARRWVRYRPLHAVSLALLGATVVSAAGWVGYWIANRDALDVGRRKQLADAAEAHVLAGFVGLASGQREQARAAFAAALAVDGECREAATGLAIVDGVLQRGGGDLAAAAPESLWGEAAWLLAHGQRDVAADVRAAADLAEAAVLRSASARPAYFFTWLEAAGWANDARAVARASTAAELLWPDSPFTHFWAGTARMQLDPGAAAASLQRALALDPSFAAARAQLANTLLQGGATAAAEAMLAEVVARDSGNAKAWINLGRARASRGDVAGALAAQRAAVTADPRLPGAYYHLGLACEASGDAPAARVVYARAVALQDGYWQAHQNLGLLLSDAAQHAAALHHLRRMAALRPDDPEAHRCLAYGCQQAGDLDGARAAFRAVARLVPEDGDAVAFLAAYRDEQLAVPSPGGEPSWR